MAVQPTHNPACTYSNQVALRCRQNWVSQTNHQRLWGTVRLSEIWCEQTEPSLRHWQELVSRGGPLKADALVSFHAARTQPANWPSYQAPHTGACRSKVQAFPAVNPTGDHGTWIQHMHRNIPKETQLKEHYCHQNFAESCWYITGFEHFQSSYTFFLFLLACEKVANSKHGLFRNGQPPVIGQC